MIELSVTTWFLMYLSAFASIAGIIVLYVAIESHLNKRIEKINQRGLESQRKGNLQEAIGLFEKAIILHQTNAVSHCNLGFALILAERWYQALNEFDLAIQLNPVMAEAFYGRGYVRNFLKIKNELVTEDFTRAKELNPTLQSYIVECYNL